MNLQTAMLLEQHFETAFAAPEGIKKLRELILMLAMQGKLVPQDPNDQPASELLKEIEAEKQQLIKAGKIKKPKPLPPITEAEKPYPLPHGWEWVQLGQVTEIIRGITFPAAEKTREPADGRIACLRTANVQKNIEWDDLLYIDRSFMSKDSQLILPSDIVMSMANSRELVGKVALVDCLPLQEVTFGGFLSVIRTYKVIEKFILYLLNTTYARSSLIDAASQTTNIANISLGKLNPLLVPLPPIAEQQRIVAKIDELMARCDELEKLRAAQAEKRLSVHSAAIAQLLNIAEPAEHQRAQAFLAEHFGELYTVKENVAELRKAILQLAVMGKLVPQDPNDPPASELLKEIEAEKQQLIKAGKIKKQKPLPPITEAEKTYPLPHGWEWVRLSDMGYVMGGGTPSKSNSSFWDGVIPWVSPKDMKVDYIFDSKDHVSNNAIDHSSIKLIPINSLLMVVRGMILAHSFPTALTRSAVTINQDMKALCLYVQNIQEYLLIYTKGMKSKFLSLVEHSTHGTCRLDSGKLMSSVIGLPPLNEQHRIVAKIDELMAWCDELERLQAAQSEKQTTLLNAVMAQV